MGRAFEYRRAAKEKRWGHMSRMFPKLAKQITAAAKEGGMDPDMNPKLRTAIQNAKSENMPKDNIDAAIKRAAGKDVDAYTEVNYEGKGPHGVLVFVEIEPIKEDEPEPEEPDGIDSGDDDTAPTESDDQPEVTPPTGSGEQMSLF